MGIQSHIEVNDLEQYSRKTCIRIQGLNIPQNTDTTDEVLLTFKEHLNITLTKHDIEAAHPLSNSRADKPAPIIVKLVRISDKENIMYKRRKLKDSGITLFEDMTRKNQLLLNRVRRDERVNNAWFYKGAVWCTINDRDFNRKLRVNLYQDIEDALIEARSFRGEQQRDFNIQRGNRSPRPQHDSSSNNRPPPRPVERAVVHVVRGTDSKKMVIGTKWRYQKKCCFSFSHTSEEYKMLWWTSVSSSLRLEKSLCLHVLSYYFDDSLAVNSTIMSCKWWVLRCLWGHFNA